MKRTLENLKGKNADEPKIRFRARDQIPKAAGHALFFFLCALTYFNALKKNVQSDTNTY